MKLAFCLFKYYPYGGLERDFYKIISAFAEKGHEVYVYTMSWEGEKPDNLHVHILPCKGLSNHRRAINFAKQITVSLRKQNFDAVFGFNRIPNLDFYYAADLCFASTAAAKHRSWQRLLPRYRAYKFLEAGLFNGPKKTTIFILTESVKKDYQLFYPTENSQFKLIPPGIPRLNLTMAEKQLMKLALQRELHIPSHHLILLQVGSDFKRKGLDRSLKAIQSLPVSLQQNLHFFIIGKNKTKNYRKYIKQQNITAHIEFLGPREDVKNFMQAADGLIHPAYYETAGMVLVEALTCGLPVIVTENCGYAHHVQKAQAGIILPSPFHQDQLNQLLKDFLVSDKNHYIQNALDYAARTDLYSMTDKIIEHVQNNLSH